MSRIQNAFKNKKGFVAFVTGGDPSLAVTEELIYAMEKAGADLIEIGIPFSDPIAEGEVIQEANERALAAGCTTDKLFELVERVRKTVEIPLAFMTYLNPIFTYGKERFMRRCEEVGIDGVIVPDLPFEEKAELDEVCLTHGIDLISLVAPTSQDRIRMIAKEAKGFLYCVSSLGVTGVRSEIKTDIKGMVTLAKEVTDIPCVIGFGISTPETAATMAKDSDGVIVGSAIVKLVAKYKEDSVSHVYDFVKSMKEAITV
jgi:tryptophan synthase alpha chain